MALSGKLYANSAHTLNTAATTAYAVARSHNVTDLGQVYGPNAPSIREYTLRTLYIKLDTLAAAPNTPTTLTVRLTRDAAGNDTVVGDTTASISYGVTTPTEGAVTIAIDFVYGHNDVSGLLQDNLHLFWFLDKGTANVRRIELTTEA